RRSSPRRGPGGPTGPARSHEALFVSLALPAMSPAGPQRSLVVGLGNPGDEFDGTRHNIGFAVLDLLAKRWGSPFDRSRLVEGLVATVSPRTPDDLPVDRVRLVKPWTFMNLSGGTYKRALKVYEADVAGALVVVDDFMLEFGQLRLRESGSSGGHRGL